MICDTGLDITTNTNEAYNHLTRGGGRQGVQPRSILSQQLGTKIHMKCLPPHYCSPGRARERPEQLLGQPVEEGKKEREGRRRRR